MIYVEHDKLEAAAKDYAKRHQSLQDILDKLEAGLAPLVGSWEGSAQALYVEKKAAWEKASRDLSDLLKSISSLTHDAHQDFLGAVSANKTMWT